MNSGGRSRQCGTIELLSSCLGRKSEAQLELSLARAVIENKKCFHKYINNKRKRTKKNLHPSLDVRGNMVMKDEDKAEVFNGFFAFVFIREINCSQGTQTSELEDGDQEREEAPVIQHKRACLMWAKAMEL